MICRRLRRFHHRIRNWVWNDRRFSRPSEARPFLEQLEPKTLLSSGALDLSFGSAGIATVHFTGGENNTGKAALVQRDGKIVVAMDVLSNRTYDFGLVRFNTDGTRDMTFGTNGQTITSSSAGFENDHVFKVLLQNDGKIIVVGTASNAITADYTFVALARFNSDGTPDGFEGVGGDQPNDFTIPADAALESDGKLLLLASSDSQPGLYLRREMADGGSDESFGDFGQLSLASGSHVAVQADGRIVVASNSNIARYNTDGTIDRLFGTNGSVSTGLGTLGNGAGPGGITVLPDGKLLFLGENAAGQLILLRYHANGNLDASFGSAGKALVAASQGPSHLMVDASGRIIVSGTTPNGGAPYVDRFNPNGSVDLSFGTAGSAPSPTIPADLALQADGKILLTSSSGTTSGTSGIVARLLTNDPLPTANQRFVAQLYLDLLERTVDSSGLAAWSGILDRGPATRTQVARAIETSPEYQTIQVQDAFGRFLNRAATAPEIMAFAQFLGAGGTVEEMETIITSSPEFVGKLGSSFPIDLNFGHMGTGSFLFKVEGATNGDSVQLQSDGTALIAWHAVPEGDEGLARFKVDGTFDTSFGAGGLIFPGCKRTDFNVLPRVLVQSDGKIVYVGTVSGQSFSNIKLVRFNRDGTLDTTFGAGGTVETSFGRGVRGATDAVLQNGKLVLAVTVDAGVYNLLRYNIDGTLDSSFGTSGVVGIPFGDRLAVQSDGRLIVSYNSAIARYNLDGSLDTTFATGGTIKTGLPPTAPFPEDVIALTATGQFIFAGMTQTHQLAVLRFNSSGTLDTTFASRGMTVLPQFGTPSSIAIDASGRILVAGGADAGGTPYLISLLPNGAQDKSFAPAASISSPLAMPVEVFVEPGGDILLAGTDTTAGTASAAVARLLPNSLTSVSFLNSLYGDALDRIIDPVAIQNFAPALDSGALRPTDVAGIIFGSAEYFTDLTEQLYRRFLHRDADSGSLAAVVNAFEHSATDQAIIAALVGSDEYLATLSHHQLA
jgi:uncharacterized delta-60 repeat protein